MSRERCRSLDRAQRKQQHENKFRFNGYVSERSPNRTSLASRTAVPRHVPSSPEINSRNYGGGLEDIGDDRRIQCFSLDDDNVGQIVNEPLSKYYTQRPLQAEDLPEEFLDDFEAPSFYELAPNSSFDEVMCTMATPPQLSSPNAAEKLDAFRAEVTEVIELDDLRKRMAAHIGTSGLEQQNESVQVDDVRRRMAAVLGENKPKPQLCRYKIPPLPDDPHEIPPAPKDPKDVVAIIRRAHAIARLKAFEEAKVAKKVPKAVAKKSVRGVTAPVKLPTKKHVPNFPKAKPTVKANRAIIPKIAALRKAVPVTKKHPPDYVPDEWAAAILRTRKLAGLRTTNPKLLPKPKMSPAPVSKSPISQALPQRSSTPTPPNFANIMERVAALRSRTDIAKAASVDSMVNVLTPTPQDELDEYEILEQLYGATISDRYPVTLKSGTNLQNRINALQQELLQTPPSLYVSQRTATPMPQEELDEFAALEKLYRATPYDQCPLTQDIKTDLQDRINALQQKLFQSPAMADTAKRSRTLITSPIEITPKRSRSPVATLQTSPSGFNDAVLENIDVPDFDVNDLPDFAFSAEALSDAGFVIGDEDSLGDISMPTFADDISLDELGLEDVTAPELCDLSISEADMAFEPDYTSERTTEEEENEIAEQIVEDQTPNQPGFLTTMVNAVVDRLRNIFSHSKSVDGQKEYEDDEFNLDSSLPNMFETTPSPKPKTPPLKEQVFKKTLTSKGPIVIPPHPKDSKDYMAIVKRAQAIQKQKAQEAAMTTVLVPTIKEKKGRRTLKSTIPKRAPLLKKKGKKSEKVYPPGEYSPSYARAVAKARSLAGLKNKSALLNPERAAKIAALKAAREAELAAIEALPPVERMRKKMEDMRKRLGTALPRPSIETLGALEAIRANLPIPKPSKPKWRPTGRLRADRRVKPSERVFMRDLGRVLIPTKITQRKKKGWREIDVMSPIVEETKYRDGDLMEFSPLKPHEGQMRLRCLKEQAAKHAAETIRAAEEAQAALSFQTPLRYRTGSPSPSSTFGTLHLPTPQFSSIQLQSPSSPRTEKTRREKVTTKIGPNGGAETIREEVTESSTIENGEVYTSTRQITTKTDEFGNVTRHIQKGKGLSTEEETFQEDLSDIEPPDFLDTSDIPPPSNPSIPTPAEIIERIRSKVQEKLNFSLPAIPRSPRCPSPATPGMIDFPQSLTDEELFDTETPEFERTPQKASPQTFSPIEKDQRMYAWGEIPPLTPPPRTATPKVSPPLPEPLKHISPLSLPKSKSQKEIICIPPHPKDPKDYNAMIKRAQAIQKLKQQQYELAGKFAPPTLPTGKSGRAPISRWVGPPPKDPKRQPRKRMVLKKRVPRVSPRNKCVQQPEEDDDDEDRVCPSEPPPLPQAYRDAVARTRLKHGLKNRTAALNPAVAAKLAAKKSAEDAAKAAFDALPEHEKIKVRMEKVRKIPIQKRRIEPSSDILGTIAAIRANMPPIEDVLRQPSPYRSPTVKGLPVLAQTTSPQTPTPSYSSVSTPQAPMRARPRSNSPSPDVNQSLLEFEFLEQYMGAMAEAPEVFAPVQEIDEDELFEIPDISLLRPYTSPEQVQSALPQSSSPGQSHSLSTAVAPISLPVNLSLEEFENLEAELKSDLSLDEFEALEAEAQILYNYDTPTRGERHWGRELAHQFPLSPRPKTKPHIPSLTPEIINLSTPSPFCTPSRSDELSPAPFVLAPSMRMLGQVGFFQEHGFFDEESILGNETLERPFITPRVDAKPGTIYYDAIQDFKVPVEGIILDTSQLMPQTPPKNLQERFKRLKEANEKRTSPPRSTQHFDVSPATPYVDFSPIRLYSPSSAPCIVSGQHEKQITPISPLVENEWLFNIDETPKKGDAAVKQFRDLDDLPFDELEYEIEPSLTNISFEKPMSPPPRPSDIIRRIRSKIQPQLQEREKSLISKTPYMLQMPEELTDEDLFELSAPSFARTPPKTPLIKYKSPRVSLPMAWGEVQPVTPVTPQPHISPLTIQPSPSRPTGAEIKEKSPLPKDPTVIPPHPKDPNDYAAIVRRAQAIYKLRKQEAEEAARAPPPPPEPPKQKVRVPISRWQGPPPKKIGAKPKRKLVLKKRLPQPTKALEDIECPAEPPPLPQEYREAVARTRLIHGLKNRTAALNPKIAAKIAAKKAAEEAAAAAYNKLNEHEKIKVRMESLRRKHHRRRGNKPTMEQIAYLEALKQIGEYQYFPLPSVESTTSLRLSVTPRAKAFTYKQAASPTSQRLSITPRSVSRKMTDAESKELAEFEDIEQFERETVCPSSSSKQDNIALKQRIAGLEEQLLEVESVSPMEDVSLAEFEAMEALEAPPNQYPTQPGKNLDINQLISDLQHQQLVTPPRIDPKERYRQLIAQRKTPPTTPTMSPVKTPEIRYSPITLPPSPSKEQSKKRAEKTTTQITRNGKNTIKEQVIETSEIVNGELQHFTDYVTTTTDPQGNVTCQINESKRIAARDRSGELKTSEELEDIEEPSFLDTTPLTPLERPRPKDIIERVRRQLKESYRPEVPTGHLIELRTPPRMLPLPEGLPEEVLDFSCPAFERTPTRSPVPSPTRSPVRSPDVSIPQLFAATPQPPTPPLPPVSPLRHRIPSPEGPIVIPSHPKDHKDFKTMCKRARKIQQLIQQNEAEVRAVNEAEAAAAVMAAAEAAKPKKIERVPISRWAAPPRKKTGIRKKLVMRKRGDILTTKTSEKPHKLEKIQPLTEEPPTLPEHYAQEVALARILSGLKNRTAALNPRVAAREAAKAEAVRKANEAKAAKLALLNATPPSPIRDYATALSRMKAFKEKGVVRQAQPSFASDAYLNAVKSAMQIREQQKPITEYVSPKTRYDRILAERTILPPTIAKSLSRTPIREDIPYSPVRFVSPRVGDRKIDLADPMEEYEFNVAAFENLNELEELGECEEPSFIDVSQYTHSEDQYMPLTPPQTPPPAPSAIISRIRQQYEQQAPICPESPPLTPYALEFPEELPDEELFDLSEPSFSKSLSTLETPIRSPNITIPHYFEESPPPRSKSPAADMAADEIYIASPSLLGVCPSVKVNTPQGPIIIPPHPKDPTDVAAMIRRAQLIHKFQAKEAAEKAAAAKATKVRVPISRRVVAKPVPKKGRLMRRLVLKKKQPDTKAKIAAPPSPRERPAGPPELPAEYLAEVDKARILAGLKNKTALLNPKVAAREQSKLELTSAEAPLSSVPAKVTPPQPDYATIMERAAALRAAKAKFQQRPTSRELTNRQNIINRQQRQERKRLLLDLERLRQQQGFKRSIEFEPTTPPPARVRLQAIKSRIPSEIPASLGYPYSPVKTPDILDIPQYQPLVLPSTPPYQYLENVCIHDIEDMSMQFDDFKDYNMDFEIGDEDDLEFQLAEAEAANAAYAEFDDNKLDDLEAEELDAIQNDFNMAERIEMLQQQLMESPNKASLLHRPVAANQEEYNMANRMEMLQKQFLQTPTTAVLDAQEEHDMAERIEMLQKKLLQTPTAHQTSVKDASKGNVCIDVSQFDEETEQYDHQDIYNEMMDDFEEMERKYI